MPSFRDRPLTWLFLAATALLDVLAVAMNFGEAWGVGLAVGQIQWVGVWTALGRSHRLQRGAVFVAAIAVYAALIAWIVQTIAMSVWVRILAPVSLMLLSAAAAALLASYFCGRWARRSDANNDQPFRYPLIEFFGWMIIVAVAATLLRYSPYARLLRDGQQAAFWFSACVTAGFSSALLVGPNRWRSLAALPFVVVVATGFLAYWSTVGGSVRDEDVHAIAIGYGYLACGLACWRLDEQLATRGEDPSTSSGPAAGDVPNGGVATDA